MTTLRRLLLLLLCLLPTSSAWGLIAGHQCDFCHDIHNAPGTSLLDQALVETLCLSCHGPTGTVTSIPAAEIHRSKTGSSYPAFRISCTGCHNSHDNMQNRAGTTNIALIGRAIQSAYTAKIATPNSGIRNVMFPSRTQFVVGAAPYDGICETCHTLTARHQNNPAGQHNHNNTRACTDCHLHETYFLRNP